MEPAFDRCERGTGYGSGVRPAILFILLAIAWSGLAAPPATLPTASAPAKTPDAFLDRSALHVVHLKLTPDAWKTMQPTSKGLFSGLFAATRPTPGAADTEARHESPFGYQYVYVRAAAECDGVALPNTGLRFKGNSSYMIAPDLKKPFKIDVNRYDADARLAGLTGFNLHNNAMDPTLMREALSYAAFRDAGVPASRTSSALVYLTVDKRYDRRLLGLYTVVEEIDKPFLKSRFGSAKGLLLKPENCFNLPYLGDDFAKYERIYRPKTEATPRTSARLIEFLRLIHQADDATFARQIGDYLDVDGFLRFIAVNALLANMDSFLSTGHNFYMYVHPDTLKVHFIPWDLNLSLGTFDWVGPIQQQADLSLWQPHVMASQLTERVLAVPAYERAYIEILNRLTRTTFTSDHLRGQVAMFEGVTARAEKLAGVPHKPLPKNMPSEIDPRVFLERRLESVRGQLAGTHEGYLPYWQKGLFGVGKPPPRGGAETRAMARASTRPTTQPAAR
jgi:spore coat protein H